MGGPPDAISRMGILQEWTFCPHSHPLRWEGGGVPSHFTDGQAEALGVMGLAESQTQGRDSLGREPHLLLSG